MLRQKNGITLIALVITIIVLLILAGVSISLVVGNNGVLTQATNAVNKNREATAREDVEMAYASTEAEYWAAWANNSALNKSDFFMENNRLQNNIKKAVGNNNVTLEKNGDNFTGRYIDEETKTKIEFTIHSNGKAELNKNITEQTNIVQLIPNTSTTVLGLLNQKSVAYSLMDEIINRPGSNDSKLDAIFSDSYNPTADFVSYPSGDTFSITDIDITDEAYAIQLNDDNATSTDITVTIPKTSFFDEYTTTDELKIMFASNYSTDVVSDTGIVLDVTKVNSDSVEFVLPASMIGNSNIEGVAILIGIYED